MTSSDQAHQAHQALLLRGRRLQYATIAWNLMEVVVTIGLGVAASSLALSHSVSTRSSRCSRRSSSFGTSPTTRRSAERPELYGSLPSRSRFLAVYLIVASTYNIVRGQAAGSSPFGIAFYLAVTAVVMFLLARLKRATLARRTKRATRRRGLDDLHRRVPGTWHPDRAGT